MVRVVVAAVLVSLVGVVSANLKLLVLHTNDMHARFQPTDQHGGICEAEDPRQCYGGMARVAAVAKIKKQEAKDRKMESIFLNAGDTYQGTPFYTFFKWKLVAKVVDLMGFDAMSLGNHEFDDGVAGLAPFIQQVKTPQVCANIDISQEPELNLPKLTKSVVLERAGYKIAVIGYLTPDTTLFSNTGKVVFQDEITAIREECARLKLQGVTIFIAVGHSGWRQEMEMAKHIEDIDVIVGGHSHTFLYSPPHEGGKLDSEEPKGPYPIIVTQPSGKEVPVVQAYFATKYLGALELEFDKEGEILNHKGEPILLDGNKPEDKQIVEVIKPYAKQISETCREVVGFSKVVLENQDNICKVEECNIGNLICDAYVDHVTRTIPVDKGRTIAAIALNQAGGIKASIDTSNNNGAITLADVMTVLPWGKKVMIHTITGKSLLEALDFSVSHYEESVVGHVSEFVQVAGLKVVYDMSRPPKQRLVSAKAICTDCTVPQYYPIDPNQHYKVILPEYIASGGDGYGMLKSITDPIVLTKIDYMILSDFIKHHKPVYPAVEERLELIGAEAALKRSNDEFTETINPKRMSKRKMAFIGGAAAAVVGGVTYFVTTFLRG